MEAGGLERALADRLSQTIKELQRHRFGRRAKGLPIDQFEMALKDIQHVKAAGAPEAEAKDFAVCAAEAVQRRTNRDALPAHLPRFEVVIDLENKACPAAPASCTASARNGRAARHHPDADPRAGHQSTKGRLPLLQGGGRAGACAGAADRGRLSAEATVAHVVVAKSADHLPLHRQAQIYARQGLKLDRSTLADWIARAAWMLRLLHERLKASEKLLADETTVPVLDPGRCRIKTGQLWAYARDDRPWNGPDPPNAAYSYAPDRKAERPIAHLAGFQGVLQVDGYASYRALADKGRRG